MSCRQSRNEGRCWDTGPTYDFVHDRLADKAALELLCVLDEHAHECRTIEVNRAMSSITVIDTLAPPMRLDGKPSYRSPPTCGIRCPVPSGAISGAESAWQGRKHGDRHGSHRACQYQQENFQNGDPMSRSCDQCDGFHVCLPGDSVAITVVRGADRRLQAHDVRTSCAPGQ